LGVYQGLNLDGGGSTTLVVRGAVWNHPSDSTGERAVGDVLLIERRVPR
jgi:exopolysaccharide biosynthesis protein